MIAIVWEFIVKDEFLPAFQRAYGPGGDWALLFRQHPGYRGTTLLHDTATPGRFLTIDHWGTEAQFEQMHRTSPQEYSQLDASFEALTVSERKLGAFEVSEPA